MAPGLGAGAAAQASGGKVSVIWVDTDGCVQRAQYCSVFLTSVTKNLAKAGHDVRDRGRRRHLPDRQLHRHAGQRRHRASRRSTTSTRKVPADLKTELDQVKADIVSGKITLTSPSQPEVS